MAELGFAANDTEAATRAENYLQTDPFPSLPQALLSSAEIHDYARVTAMLFPFYPESLKSASYEAHIGGAFIRWDDKENRIEKTIKRGGKCILPPNSISFVEVEPQFRLPNYLAIRFNLRITHVHRGLLLGTGPLVDPGFEGKLLIPLHNLTATEYHINTNDALIWIEFTKTTFGATPSETEASSKRAFKGFPKQKKNMRPDEYLKRASDGDPIQSSIPVSIARAQQAATNAETTLRRIFLYGSIAALVGLGSLGLGLFQYFGQFQALVQDSMAMTNSVIARLSTLSAASGTNQERMSGIEKILEDRGSEIRSQRALIKAIENSRSQELAELRAKLDVLSGKLEQLRNQPDASPPPQ